MCLLDGITKEKTMKLQHNTQRAWLDNDIYIELLNEEWEHCPLLDFDQLFYNRQRAKVEARYPALKGLVDSNEDYQCSWKLPTNLRARRKLIKQLLNR
jgi:hypothetical protein